MFRRLFSSFRRRLFALLDTSLDAAGLPRRFEVREDVKLVRQSDYMDADFYLDRNPEVSRAGLDPAKHFVLYGWKEGRSPSAGFSVHDYLIANPDVAAAGINPLIHYLRVGHIENRRLSIPPYGEYLRETVNTFLDEAPDTGTREIQPPLRLAAAIHVFYEDLAVEFLEYVQQIPDTCDLFLTTSDPEIQRRIEEVFAKYRNGSMQLKVVPNRGRDIAPFLLAFPELFERYDLVCKIHTKRSIHSDAGYADTWRQYLLDSLLGNARIVSRIVDIFQSDDSVGLLYPPANRDVYPYVNWIGYEEAAASLLSDLGIDAAVCEFEEKDFPAGTMFWVRPQALRPLLDRYRHGGYENFPEEPVPKDFTLMHVLERIVPVVCESAGYKVVCGGVRSRVGAG